MKYYRLILCILLIAILCFTPGNQIRDVKLNIPYLDKWGHLFMFFGLSFFIRGVQDIKIEQRSFLYLIGVSYAAIIEVIQYKYIPMRTGDVYDFAADILGMGLGYLLYNIMPNFLLKYTK